MAHRMMQWFAFDHLPEHLREISEQCGLLARTMDATLPDGPEKTAGLRKLLEAKDCFVRAEIEGGDDRPADKRSAAARNPIVRYEADGLDVMAVYRNGERQRADRYTILDDAAYAADRMNQRLAESAATEKTE